MQHRLDQWTTALSAILIVGALLACKKKIPATTTPSAEPVAAPAPVATPPAAAATTAAATAAAAQPGTPKLGDVKRYPDREKPQTGAVKILENGVKVFNDTDDKTPEVATLDKDLLVFRLASVPDWELVEFPSGVGKVSPGWVPAKFVDTKADARVARDAVAAQPKQAAVSSTASGAPKSSASAADKPAASASAKAAADAKAKAADAKAKADKAAADKAAADAKAAADKAIAAAKRAADRAAKAAQAAGLGGTAPK